MHVPSDPATDQDFQMFGREPETGPHTAHGIRRDEIANLQVSHEIE